MLSPELASSRNRRNSLSALRSLVRDALCPPARAGGHDDSLALRACAGEQREHRLGDLDIGGDDAERESVAQRADAERELELARGPCVQPINERGPGLVGR